MLSIKTEWRHVRQDVADVLAARVGSRHEDEEDHVSIARLFIRRVVLPKRAKLTFGRPEPDECQSKHGPPSGIAGIVGQLPAKGGRRLSGSPIRAILLAEARDDNGGETWLEFRLCMK